MIKTNNNNNFDDASYNACSIFNSNIVKVFVIAFIKKKNMAHPIVEVA